MTGPRRSPASRAGLIRHTLWQGQRQKNALSLRNNISKKFGFLSFLTVAALYDHRLTCGCQKLEFALGSSAKTDNLMEDLNVSQKSEIEDFGVVGRAVPHDGRLPDSDRSAKCASNRKWAEGQG
jgi:hypothetical protein